MLASRTSRASQPGTTNQVLEEISKKELELGVAGDGNVEARLGFGGVAGVKLGTSEVPVELDSLVVVVVGQVDGFGPGSSAPEQGEG